MPRAGPQGIELLLLRDFAVEASARIRHADVDVDWSRMDMKIFRMPIRIEWGKCDAAGITFYPNYFAWFDAATWQMFEKEGVSPYELHAKGVNIPIADAHAHFTRPGLLGDHVVVESQVAEWQDRFFLVRHRILRDGEPLLEGEELRAWVIPHPDDPRRFKAVSIPAEVIEAFS